MDIRRLRYFARIVELGSISQAAVDLHIAQPALSKNVLALEADLGTPLLHRSPQGVSPTDAGIRLYEHAQIILNQLDRARVDVCEASNIPAGQVTIGMSYSTTAILLVPLLRAAQERLPRVRLQIIQEPRQTLPDRILSGRVDIGVLVYPNNRAGIYQTPILKEELKFICSPDFARRYPGGVPLSAIAPLPLILPTRANSLRILIDSLFLVHALPTNVVHEADAIGQFIDCVESGLASTFLPASCLGRALAHRNVEACSITDQDIFRIVTIACSHVRSLGNAACHVEALLRDVVRNVVTSGAWMGATSLDKSASRTR